MEKTGETYHIAFATDDNYAPYLSVAIQSIKDTQQDGVLCVVYILTDGLLPENKEKLAGMGTESMQVRIVDVSSKMEQAGTFGLHYLSKSTYYRLYLSELLPDLDRILYLDCDVLVRRDLEALYNTEMGDCYVAACQDLGHRLPEWKDKAEGMAILAAEGVSYSHYFNAGVILMNLAAMRRDDVMPVLIRLAGRQDFKWQDQDVFNVACKGKWVVVPMEWNYSLHVHSPETLPRLPQDPAEAAIAHFTTRKPWKGYYSAYAEEWCATAMRSPFREWIRASILGKYRITTAEIIFRPLYALLAHMRFLPQGFLNRAIGKSNQVRYKGIYRPCCRVLEEM